MEKRWGTVCLARLTLFRARSKGVSPAALCCLLFCATPGEPRPPNTAEKPKGREKTLNEGGEGAESERGNGRVMDQRDGVMEPGASQGHTDQEVTVATREIPIR